MNFFAALDNIERTILVPFYNVTVSELLGGAYVTLCFITPVLAYVSSGV